MSLPTYRLITKKFIVLNGQMAVVEEMVQGDLLVSEGCLEFRDEEGVVSSAYPAGAWLTCERVEVVSDVPPQSPIVQP